MQREGLKVSADAVSQARSSVVALWALVSIHHAYEAGHYNDPSKLIAIFIATAILPLTLVPLGRYERSGSWSAYRLFSVVTLVFWVGIFGLFMGTYSYVLKDALFLTHAVSLTTLSAMFPLEHIPPTDLFHEGTGILMSVLAAWVVVAWRGLAAQHRQPRQIATS